MRGLEFPRDNNPIRPVTSAGTINREGSNPTAIMSAKEREEEFRRELSRRKREWYEDKFNDRPSFVSAAAEKIMGEAPVVAELRTNVIVSAKQTRPRGEMDVLTPKIIQVKDEFTIITNLSSEIAMRYRRPENSVMVTLSHSTCLMLGGTFDPAYMLTISTIPEYVQEATNMRNTHFIQRFLDDHLSVPPSRGIVRYITVPESMLGINGVTVQGQIIENEIGLRRDLTSRSHRKSFSTVEKRKSTGAKEEQIKRNTSTKSVKSAIRNNGSVSLPHALPPKPNGGNNNNHLDPARANSISGASNRSRLSVGSGPPNARRGTPSPTPASRPSSARKSILKMTGQDRVVPPPPPPVNEAPLTSRFGKRKSFVSIFKRDRDA